MELVLILPILAVTLPGIVAGGSTQLVYDTDGNALSTDSQYHVLPADDHNRSAAAAGALRAFQGGTGIEKCPVFLGQGQEESSVDLVEFKPRDNSSTAVHLSSDVTISFSNLFTFCMQSTGWFVANRSPIMSPSASSEPRQYVAVGSPNARFESPSADVFRIEEFSSGGSKGYKLVSAAGTGGNRGLGLYASFNSNSKQDRSWMVVSDSPLPVVFKKGSAKAHA